MAGKCSIHCALPLVHELQFEYNIATDLAVIERLSGSDKFLVVAGSDDSLGRKWRVGRNEDVVDEASVAIRHRVRAVVRDSNPLHDGVALTVRVGPAPATLIGSWKVATLRYYKDLTNH